MICNFADANGKVSAKSIFSKTVVTIQHLTFDKAIMNVAFFILILLFNHELISIAHAVSRVGASASSAANFFPDTGGLANTGALSIPNYMMNIGNDEDVIQKRSSCPCKKVAVDTRGLLRSNNMQSSTSFIQVDCEGKDCENENQGTDDSQEEGGSTQVQNKQEKPSEDDQITALKKNAEQSVEAKTGTNKKLHKQIGNMLLHLGF